MNDNASRVGIAGVLSSIIGPIVCLVLLPVPVQAQLVVTEVMFNPNDENVWEWIEVENTGGSSIDLNGYLGFNMGDAEPSTLNPTIDGAWAENTVIGPGDIAVIYDANYGAGAAPGADPNNFVDANFRTAWGGLSASVPLIGANYWPGLSNSTGSPSQSVAFWANAGDYAMDVTPVEDDPINNPGVFTNRVTSFANAQFSIDYSGASFPAVDGDSSIAWSRNGVNSDGSKWVKSTVGDGTGATTSVLVEVPGFINNTDDFGNPGVVPPGTPAFASSLGLHITEIMYDPASEPDNNWEWVEIYNSSVDDINLAGWVLDDFNTVAVSAANIASGMVPAGGTAILFNGDAVDTDDFKAAWGAGLNAIPVSEWGDLALNSGGDQIALWTSFGNYSGDHQAHLNAEISLNYDENNGFPSLSNGPTITLADLSFDPSDGGNWDNAINGDGVSFNANAVAAAGGTVPLHGGGDVGSPGVSNTIGVGTPGDFDGDGDVDGADFLEWQRGNSPNPLSAGDLDDWQMNYGASLVAAVAAVPEPASLCLLAFALLPICGRHR